MKLRIFGQRCKIYKGELINIFILKKSEIVKFLIISLVFIVEFNSKCFAHEENKELHLYLNDNCSSNAEILYLDAEKYDVFLTGENHTTQKNFSIQLEMIKYLSQKTDLKYILFEGTFASAKFINEYLKTGNVDNLDIIFNDLKGTSAGVQEYYYYLEQLYEFNKSLSDEKRL